MKAIRHVAGHVFGCGRSAFRSAGICPWWQGKLSKSHVSETLGAQDFKRIIESEMNLRVFCCMSSISTVDSIDFLNSTLQKFINVPESIFQPVCRTKRKILSIPVILVCESSPLGCGRWWFHWHPTPWTFGKQLICIVFWIWFFETQHPFTRPSAHWGSNGYQDPGIIAIP